MGTFNGLINTGGGSSGSGGGGSGSGITSINGKAGPVLQIDTANGVALDCPTDSTFVIDVAELSGIVPLSSGIESVNAESGPHIDIYGSGTVSLFTLGKNIIVSGVLGNDAGVNGIQITQDSGNNIIIFDGHQLSGVNAIQVGNQNLIGPEVSISGINIDVVQRGASGILLIGVSGIQTIEGAGNVVVTTQGDDYALISGIEAIGVNGIQISDTTDSLGLAALLFDGIQLSGLKGLNGIVGSGIQFQGVNGLDVLPNYSNDTILLDVQNISGVRSINGTTGNNDGNINILASGDARLFNYSNTIVVSGITISGVNGIDTRHENFMEGDREIIFVDGTSLSGTYKAAQTFTSSLTWTLNHTLNTSDVIVQTYNNVMQQIFADTIDTSDANQVVATFNTMQAGRMIVVG
jgi:hypothetical protein